MWFYILIALAAGIVLLIRFLKPVYYTGSKPNLNSKTAIVTGGGGSIGLEIVKDLAKQNCFVIIADITNSQQIAKQINSSLGTNKVSYQYIDLGDLESIKQFVISLQRKKLINKLDYLVCNAGVMGNSGIKYTKSKRQYHFGVNYIGHFYLTHLLWEYLYKAQHFRIIITSSIAHKKVLGFKQNVILQFDKLNFQNTIFCNNLAYSRSKLCLTMLAKSLSEIINNQKGLAVSVHPGVVYTNLFRVSYSKYHKILVSCFNFIAKISMKNCWQGAQTTLFALYQNPNKIQSGSYYADCAKSQWNPFVDKNHKKLFQITQQSLKIKFGEQ